MPFDSPRGDAIYRIAYVVLIAWWWLPIVGFVAIVAGLIWMLFDVLMQLWSGMEAWTPGGTGRFQSGLERLARYPLEQLEWAVFGKGSFPWLP